MDALPVCRFYGTPGKGPNSHFYTSDAAECAAVKMDPGWTYEGVAFYAVDSGSYAFCTTDFSNNELTKPVYRLYNNRFASNDSNHRFTTEISLYREMPSQGWKAEGVAFCSPW